MIRRFEARGGVPLGEPVRHHKVGKFRFRCGLCGNLITNDQTMEPLCTGPSWTDDHPPEVMMRLL